MGEIISRECIGVIEAIDDNQASVYYILEGKRVTFGRVGDKKIYYYANVGDSIIKQSNSSIIKVKKFDSEQNKEFEIY
jgi:hypothetical protein